MKRSGTKETTTSEEEEGNILGPFPTPFKSGNYRSGNLPRSVVELSMMSLSNEIRNKPDWIKKILDKSILDKWRKEFRRPAEEFDYVIEELKYLSNFCVDGLCVGSVDGVWQSDSLIPLDLKEVFKSQVARLENIPLEKRDWHPGTNNLVWDLVHPSLYCLVYNRSQYLDKESGEVPSLERMGGGTTIVQEGDIEQYSYYKSKKYQWLPADFEVNLDGKVKILSYINNLHPVHFKDLYQSIGCIFERFVPLFEKVLAEQMVRRPLRVEVPRWYREEEEEEEDRSNEEDLPECREDERIIHHPPVPPFNPSSIPKFQDISLKGRKLQVIVKLANTELSPDHPSFPPGTWHVEGMINESIVASGIYYYHFENISTSKLAFRQAVCEPDYEQDDNRGVSEIYGLSNDEPLCQEWGDIITCEDRAIVFPNIYQHQIQGFGVSNAKKEGKRKILVFFLVNPTKNIISTADIPPQQFSWFQEILRNMWFFKKLPKEVFDKIMNYLDWPMKEEEAFEHREGLMNERKVFRKMNDNQFFQRAFSLCEH